MAPPDSLDKLSHMLGRAGYYTTREPVDIGAVSSATDCEIIARNDEYNIIYMEAASSWRGAARSVAESQGAPCLVATRHGSSMIMTTIQGKMTRNARPRHIVIIAPDSEKYGLSVFVRMIRSTEEDDFLSIDEKVQNAFDAFSKYDEALKKFGENLDDVIKDTKNMVMLRAKKSKPYLAESEKFAAICKEILNDTIRQEDVTSMLIQHIITARIFATVYDYDFVGTNSIARELERLRNILNIRDDLIDYSDILLVAESITSDEERQQFIRRIYETFYQKYDPKRADRDGIVYTPIEIVDFILNSVQYVLQTEFDTDFSDRSVKILDPFTGTGTFLARLLTSGMLGKQIAAKYKEDIFANELLLLAFYIATVNMESTYADITNNKDYVPFEGMNYTDTFMMNPRYLEDTRHRQEETKIDKKFVDIRKRRQRQRKTNLHIIVTNPPYSAGQSNYNEQSPNIEYPEMRKRIEVTYLENTKAINPSIGLTRSLYDSYIQSIRWASDRIGESGIIGFVTNASFVQSDAGVGVRACLQQEFTDVWVFDLLGKKGVAGHGRNVFEYPGISTGGTTTQIAIVFLVKNPNKKKHRIHYSALTKLDYSGPDKRLKIKKLGSIKGIRNWKIIKPDKHHDWLGQRSSEFDKYLPMGSKDAKAGKGRAMFRSYSAGIASGRDVWIYNTSKKQLEKNMKTHINYCKTQDLKNPIINPKKAKWSEELSDAIRRTGKQPFTRDKVRIALYRPFYKQYMYFDKAYNHRRYLIPTFFPKNNSKNLAILVPDKGIGEKFSTVITDQTPDLHAIAQSQCFSFKAKTNKGQKLNVGMRPDQSGSVRISPDQSGSVRISPDQSGSVRISPTIA